MAAEYFPLKKDVRLEYRYKSSEFDGAAKVFVDFLSVAKKPGKTVAQVRMTFELRDTHTDNYSVTRDPKWLTAADGIVVGGRKEFPLPPRKGAQWEESPDSSEIVSLTDKVSVKAGKFKNCMKIVTKLDGGRSGRSVRYYAPGVGYVFEEYDGGDKVCEMELVAVGKVPPAPPSKKKSE